MQRKLFILACFAFALAHAFAAIAPVNSAMGTTLGGASATATFPGGNMAGDAYAIGVAVSNASGIPTLVLSASNGDIASTLPQACQQQSHARLMCMYWVSNSNGGANTLTATITNESAECPTEGCTISIVAEEYSGTSSYALEAITPPVMTYSQASITSATATSITANTEAIALGFSIEGTGTSYAAPGFTQRAATSVSKTSFALLDEAVSAPGSISATVSNSQNLDAVGLLVLRSVLPAIGAVQSNVCSASTAATTFTCSLPAPVAAGDMVIATQFGGDAAPPASGIPISDNLSSTWQQVPDGFYSGPPGGITTFYAANVAAGSMTVTFATASTQVWDVYLTEVHGAASTRPLVNSTLSFVRGSAPFTSSTTAGPLTVAAETYIYSVMGDQINSNMPYASAAGFVPRLLDAGPYGETNNYLHAAWDQVAASAGAYSNTVSGASTEQNAAVFLAAFSATPQTGPQIVQERNGGGSGTSEGTSRQFTQPVQAGHLLVVVGAWQFDSSAGTNAISDSCGSTWTQMCGNANSFYGVWTAPVAANCVDTVTLIPQFGETTGISIMELAGLAPDTCTGTQATNISSVSSAALTVNSTDEYVLSFGVSNGACTESADFNSVINGWTDRQVAGSNCTVTKLWDQFTTSGGTFSQATSTVGSVSANLAAGVIGFKASVTTATGDAAVGGNATLGGSVSVQ